MLGKSGEIEGERSPALPMTILDVQLEKGARFAHEVPAGQAAFLLSIDGTAKVELWDTVATLSHRKSIAFRQTGSQGNLVLTAAKSARIVLLQGAPINENFVLSGPFAMSTQAEVNAMFAAHDAGQLGSIDTS